MNGGVLALLQQKVYRILNNDLQLKSVVTGIYNHVPQDTKFPYIYLGKMSATDLSTVTTCGYQVIYEINIFTREWGNKVLLEIVYEVQKLLTDASISLPGHHLSYIYPHRLEISEASDGVTFMANLKIKAGVMSREE